MLVLSILLSKVCINHVKFKYASSRRLASVAFSPFNFELHLYCISIFMNCQVFITDDRFLLIDSESILANIKKEQSCPDMNISCIGEINHEFIYQCGCCPQDIGEVTMVCEDQ